MRDSKTTGGSIATKGNGIIFMISKKDIMQQGATLERLPHEITGGYNQPRREGSRASSIILQKEGVQHDR